MLKDAELCSLQTEWVFKYAVLLRKICGAQVKHLLFCMHIEICNMLAYEMIPPDNVEERADSSEREIGDSCEREIRAVGVILFPTGKS